MKTIWCVWQAVGSVGTSDKDYRKALQGPLYTRIRAGLESRNKLKTTLADVKEDKHEGIPPKGRGSYPLSAEIRPLMEIVEEEPEQNQIEHSSNVTLHADKHVRKENMFISPEVDRALRILDQAIAVLRERGFSGGN